MSSADELELQELPNHELLSRLGTSKSGLTREEAERRLRAYGPNELARRKKRTGIIEFLYHLSNPLIVILLIAGLISLSSGDKVDAVIIFSIVVISLVLDNYQESKANKAAEALQEKVTTTATVIRNGAKQEVRLGDIVPGDVVSLSAGDMVPADSRIVEVRDLFADQSALTGESFPVEKTDTPPKTKASTITECSNCLFLGTSIISGTALAVVVKTGNSTEYGKIAQKLVAREPETEYERGLRRFGYLMVQITLLLALFVFFVNALFKRGVLESLLFSVALAVGLTPELLPMILSINLSRGAIVMSKKGVIVKRLEAIENFGSMDVLCTDKTGTLTENKISLVRHVDIDGKDNEAVLLYSYLNSYYETGLRSPLDEAILSFQHIDPKGFQKVDEVPFDFTRRRVSIIVDSEKGRLMLTKGAPEEVARICSTVELGEGTVEFSEALRKSMQETYNRLSSQGFRVLAVAYRRVDKDKSVYSVSDESDMIFRGFVAFMDPPKESAKESLQLLKESCVELKILTGDNELVTRRVCEDLSFEVKGVVLGSQINLMRDDGLARVVEAANIFARVTPAQKDRIMSALKRNGHVVGFLGDGINDAPSLKTADVGMSVDNAVDVAKEAADIILLQKSLRVLNDGVLEGRKTFGNTMKYIMMGTSSNFGNMFSVAAASLFLPFLPMLPTQILLNNLLYDLSESTIPTDNVDPEYAETPKKMDVSFIRRFMVFLGPISSVFDFVTFFIMLFVFNASVPLFQTAWFIESLSTQTFVVFVIRTRRTPFYRSRPSRPLLLSSLTVIATALIVPFTPLGSLFGFEAPPLLFYAILVGLILAYMGIVEAVKTWFYKRYSHKLEQVSVPNKG